MSLQETWIKISFSRDISIKRLLPHQQNWWVTFFTFIHKPVFWFTETWLNDSVPDMPVELPGFVLYQTIGGGVEIYINQSWCNDVEVFSISCTPDLGSLILNCRPIYLPFIFHHNQHTRCRATSVQRHQRGRKTFPGFIINHYRWFYPSRFPTKVN